MAEITIPENEYEGLAMLLSLSDESANELITALEQSPPKLFPSDLVLELVPKVPSIEPLDLDEIIDTLHTMYLTKVHHDIPPAELAESICDAIEEIDEEDLEEIELEFIPEKREPFKERLTR